MRANFYLSSTPEEELFDELLEKYLIIDVRREEAARTYGEEVASQATDADIVERYEDHDRQNPRHSGRLRA